MKLKTVKELIAELLKFPEDATIEAYEGECNGINVFHPTRDGFIYSSSEKVTEGPHLNTQHTL